jgi:hypothetical protein
VAISTHCIGSCISNCHTITVTTVPVNVMIYLKLYYFDLDSSLKAITKIKHLWMMCRFFHWSIYKALSIKQEIYSWFLWVILGGYIYMYNLCKQCLGETHRPVASHWQTLSHNVIHISLIEIRTTSVVMSTHCIDSCISNCHMITATTVPVDVMIYLTIVLSDNHSQSLSIQCTREVLYIYKFYIFDKQ